MQWRPPSLLMLAMLAAAAHPSRWPADGDGPDGPTPDLVAARVVEAFRDDDQAALAALAERSLPDPFLVANVLWGWHLEELEGAPPANLDFLDALVQWAGDLAGDPAAGTLTGLVERWSQLDEEGRRQEMALREELQHWRRGEHVERESPDDQDLPSVTLVELHLVRSAAWKKEGKGPDTAREQERAASLALGLGWLTAARSACEVAAREWWSVERFEDSARCWAANGEACRRLVDAAGQARALAEQGDAFAYLGRYDEALPILEQAVQVHEHLEDHAGLARTLVSRSRVEFGQRRVESALATGERALQESEASGDREVIGDALDNLAQMTMRSGRMDRALERFERALEFTDDPYDRVLTQANIGVTASRLGHYRQALDSFLVFQRFLEGQGSTTDLSTNLGNLGICNQNLGRFAAAVTCFEAAVDGFSKIGNLPQTARWLSELALLQHDCGDYQEALALHQRLAAVREQAGRADPIDDCRSLSHLRAHLGDYEEAHALLEKALSLCPNDPNGDGWHPILRAEEARLRMWQGDDPGALAVWDELLAQETEQGVVQSATLDNRGACLSRLGRHEEARKDLQQALALSQQERDLLGASSVHYHLAQVEHRTGNPEAAMEQVRRGLEIDRVLGRGLAEDGLGLRIRTRECAELGLACTSDLLEERALGDSHLVAAFEFAEWSRATVLGDRLARRESFLEARLPTASARNAAVARGRVTQAFQVLRGLAGVSSDAPEWGQARRQFDQAYRDLVNTIGRLQQDHGAVADVVWPDPVPLVDAQAALSADEALLHYQSVLGRWLCLVTTRQGIRLFHLAETGLVDPLVEDYLTLVAMPGTDDTRLAAKLHDLLVAPLQEALTGVSRLHISPDSGLAFLPFEALRDPAGQRLLEKVEVTYVPSATVLIRLRQLVAQRPAGVGLVALGDPLYSAEAGTGAASVHRAARLRGLSGLARLAASGKEVQELAERFPEEERRVFRREQASVESLDRALAEMDGPLAVLHLACHGHLDLERPWLSGLVLAKGEVLSLSDLYQRALPSDLAVLSACRTAVGLHDRAEGVLGLVRGFFVAGCPRVVVSNWTVDDQATRELMNRFYYYLRSEGMAPAAALRAAKQELQAAGKPPSQWAAFVLWGLAD